MATSWQLRGIRRNDVCIYYIYSCYGVIRGANWKVFMCHVTGRCGQGINLDYMKFYAVCQAACPIANQTLNEFSDNFSIAHLIGQMCFKHTRTHTHTHTHTYMLCANLGTCYILAPKWGRVCRVFNTRNCDFNPLTGDHFGHIHINRDFNPLTGDASYALYTQLFLNVPAGSFLEYALNIPNISKM